MNDTNVWLEQYLTKNNIEEHVPPTLFSTLSKVTNNNGTAIALKKTSSETQVDTRA